MRATLAACLWLPAVPAAGQDDAARLEAAQQHILRGRAHFQAGRYAEGIADYELAYAAFPDPRQLFVIASAHERTEARCTAASPAWTRFLQACPDCEERSTAEAALAALTQTCPVSVQITSEPAGALVEVDGRALGQTPLGLMLAPGPHAIAAELDALPRLRTEVDITPGTPVLVPLRFGEPVVVQPVLPAPAERDNTWSIAALSVAGIGATTGIVFLAQMVDSVDDFEGAESRTAALNARDDAQRQAVLAQIGFGVAAAGLAVGWLLW